MEQLDLFVTEAHTASNLVVIFTSNNAQHIDQIMLQKFKLHPIFFDFPDS